MRKGGFSASVPCAVDAATIDVGLLDPQAHNSAVLRAALKGLSNLNMALPTFTKHLTKNVRPLTYRYFFYREQITSPAKSTPTKTNGHPLDSAPRSLHDLSARP